MFVRSFFRSRPYWSLFMLVFITGVVTMSLEFSTGRILIPVFGSSLYTWGSLIGVILVGLSLGYHIGGRLADRDPSFLKFCAIIFSAGLYIVFIPFVSPMVMGFSTLYASESQYASLLATSILLMMPTFLLGIVTPYAVKLATNTLSKLGNIAGNLYSVSTIGSIIGTFLTVFVLIPEFEIRYIIFFLGLTLMILSSLIGLSKLPRILAISVVLLLFFPTTSLVGGIVSHYGTLVYEKETPYSHLDITDLGNARSLYLNGLLHSKMYKDNPTDLAITYTKYFHLGFLFNGDAKNILFIGGGGFSGPKNFLNVYPNATIDVVEIDPDVIDAAKKYFSLDYINSDLKRLRIFNEDARNFISNTNQQYDIIILDAFSKSYVPFHLMTLEYFKILEEKLGRNGVVISNLIGSGVGDTSDLFRAVYKTMSEVFPSLYVFPTVNDNFVIIQNVMLIGTKTDKDYNKFELTQIASKNNTFYKDIPYATDFVEDLYERKIKTDDVPLLTDKLAPVENLINPITSRSYIIEEQIGPSKRTGLPWTENTMLSLAILTLIVILWVFYMKKIWKRQIHNNHYNITAEE